MIIEIFTLCDNAQVYDNKLVVVGPFSQIISGSFPATHPSFSIVGRISYEHEENGTKTFKLTVSDSDGNDLISPFELKAEVKVEPNETANINFNVNLLQTQFDKPGIYKVRLISEDIDRTIKLYVIEKKL